MKKFIAVIIAVIALVSSVPAFAYDYVVIKNGEKITITKITTYDTSSPDVSSFDFVNPTISQLSSIGLPSYCWPWVNGEDGAYDTRLTKASQDFNEMKANYENEVESTRYLEGQVSWITVYQILLGGACLAIIILIVNQKSTIRRLKQNQK